LHHLKDNPHDAASVEWTLSLDGTPIYVIRPLGPFAAEIYGELREFLNDQVNGRIDCISVAGVVAGNSQLLNGQSVPAVIPELRGMNSWSLDALVTAVVPNIAANASAAAKEEHQRKREAVRNSLSRIYHELRNLGMTPQHRALNYAAANAFALGEIFESALREDMELDSIGVSPSPIARPGSECWDVELYFFYPQRQVQTVRKVYRYTVDVSDTVPVTVGTTRSWFTR
jgi:cyanobactin maturation PatA/PatG family protease